MRANCTSGNDTLKWLSCHSQCKDPPNVQRGSKSCVNTRKYLAALWWNGDRLSRTFRINVDLAHFCWAPSSIQSREKLLEGKSNNKKLCHLSGVPVVCWAGINGQARLSSSRGGNGILVGKGFFIDGSPEPFNSSPFSASLRKKS